MKPLYLVFCLMMLSRFALGQVIDPQYLKLPSFAPPSPEAASIQKFGGMPVNTSNGTTSIDVAVWNISCGPISWPISISYGTAGIRVDEVSSNIGTGWSLAGQGVITRSVAGRPDEEVIGEPDYEDVMASWDEWYYLYGVLDGTQDSEYDLYSYSFNGKSGKFYIKQDGQVFCTPYTTMKIIPISTGFTIVDENGYIYTFDKKEMVSPGVPGQGSYASSWYMTKVQTADKKQSILFNYVDDGIVNQTSKTFTQGLGNRPNSPECSGDHSIFSGTPDLQTNTSNTYVCKLTDIVFPNGTINFTYASDRADISGTGNHRLTKIEIKQSATGTLLKRFSLSQSYFSPGNRLKLNSIVESRASSAPNKTYTFEYNSTAMVPVGSYAQDIWGFNNGKTSNPGLIKTQTVLFNGNNYNMGDADRSVDTVATKAGILTAVNWPTGGRTEFTYDVHQYYPGFYATTSSEYSAIATALPQTATTTFTYPSTTATNPMIIVDISRYDDPSSTGIPYVQLKDLTTGLVVFSMENSIPANTLHSEQSVQLVPGRSYEIKSFVFTSSTTLPFRTAIKINWSTYTTTPAIEKGGGVRVRMVKNFTKSGVLAGTDYYQYEPGVTLSSYHFINRSKKTVKFRTGNNNCNSLSSACDIYYANSIYPITTVGGSPIMYTKVTKYQLDASGVDKGKVEYEYNVLRDQILHETMDFSFVYFTKNDWKNGTLLRETHYKRTGTGANDFTPVKKTENQYQEIKIDFINSLQVKTMVVSLWSNPEHEEFASQDMEKFYVPLYTGVNKLYKTIETTYDDNGNVLTSTVENQYNAASHDYLTKTIRTDSKGVDIASEYKYPVDFAASGNVYSMMVAKNIVSPVIEKKQFKETTSGSTTTQTLLATVKTDYRNWKNDSLVLAPEFVKTSLNSDALINKIVYTNYNDRKQPTAVKKEQDVPVCILYGYNYSYPVAEVTNAVEANIAYTSFEGDNGGWVISGTPLNDATAPTGKKAFLFSSILSRTGVSTTNSYIVSYWKKSGTVTISGSTVTTGRTVNGWTYYEHKINSPASSTISVTGSAATIDELRLYPASNTTMTTYTYDPLVGLSSKCDPNNRITYYEYDELQRLILIRDLDKNIVKKISYKYETHSAVDNIYYSVAKSGNFQKTGCTSCLVGSVTTYTVPAGSYSSTYGQAQADSLAQLEVDNNGQAYADTYGTCITATDASVLSTISISKGVQYTFYNTCTGVSYVRNRTGNETDWSLFGIPQGTYDVTFVTSPAGTHTFKVITSTNTYTRTTLSPTTILGVVFGATGNKVTVTP